MKNRLNQPFHVDDATYLALKATMDNNPPLTRQQIKHLPYLPGKYGPGHELLLMIPPYFSLSDSNSDNNNNSNHYVREVDLDSDPELLSD